jgi:hypothetical protein
LTLEATASTTSAAVFTVSATPITASLTLRARAAVRCALPAAFRTAACGCAATPFTARTALTAVFLTLFVALFATLFAAVFFALGFALFFALFFAVFLTGIIVSPTIP